MKKLLLLFLIFPFIKTSPENFKELDLKSDLMVNFQAPANAYQGENIKEKIKVVIKNNGKKETKNLFLDISIKIDRKNEKICGRTFILSVMPLENLIPSGIVPSIPFDIEPGKYKICAIVDSLNSVEEENEENNKSCQIIEILEKKNVIK